MNPLLTKPRGKIGGLMAGLVFLGLVFILSMTLGQVKTPITTLIEVLINFNPSSTEHIIIATTRISRTFIAILIGASLAIAGALMQALTRNPLASPSIFGINSGALFFVVSATVFLSISSLFQLMWIAFIGGSIAAVMVFFLGSLGKDSLSPIKIILSGTAITAFFSSLTQGLLVLDEQSLEGVLFWLGGSVSGRNLNMILPILPFMAAAGVIAFLLGNSINILTSGEDIAKSLGQRVLLIKTIMGIVIVFLAGGSVAVGGAIGFIGLIVPHLVRAVVGIDHRWIIPYCAVFGGTLLLLADIVARLVIIPEEMPIGVMTAFIGVPFFIYMARRGA
ncbi:iron complex transport system permease protein [Clostridium homopropionicum]|nr:iron complex transport system permease protein [Clostridium homopropionicum]